jgi:hypothetical protein
MQYPNPAAEGPAQPSNRHTRRVRKALSQSASPLTPELRARFADPDSHKRLAYTIANTCRALDIGWSTLYQLIADGAIRTIKNRPKNPYYRRRAAPLPRQLRRGVIAHVRDGRGAGAQ